MAKLPTIAIDGLAASGKGTLARRLGKHLHYAVLDTGKLYRLIGLLSHKHNIAPDDEAALATLAQNLNTTLQLSDLSDPALKSDLASRLASQTSQYQSVRDALVDFQRSFAAAPPAEDGARPWQGVILDGRDIGTVILPAADIKFFITANPEIRAARRFEELKETDPALTYDQVLTDLINRDKRDSTRSAAPAIAAPDAITIDTSDMSITQVMDTALAQLS